jgi:glycosyltransferase involved in cell wall biosynthesis
VANQVLVLVTSSFPIGGDGSEAAGSFVVDLVEELARHIHVRVVAPGRATTREQWAEKVTIHRYAAPVQPLSTLKPWRLSDLRWIWRVWWGGTRATHEAATGATAHVFALWALPCGAWARRAARAHGIGYSVWMLGSDVWSLGRLPLMRRMLRTVMRDARHRYADGLQLARDSEAICNLPVEFLPTTRALTTRDPPPTASAPPYRFVFIGRWHRNKGIDLLLDALALLGDSDWSCITEVAIYGGGPLRTLVHEKAKPLLDAGRPLVIGGFIPKAEAECAIVRADWLLIPSRIESIPVVFSDAMKLSRPVIATPVGDLPQLVGGGCGIVCAAVDPPAIASAIRIACRDTAERAASLAACAERFSLRSVARQILQGANGE